MEDACRSSLARPPQKEIRRSRFRRDNPSAEEMDRAMKDIATGSQIAFSDRAGNRYNALVSSTTSQRVNLRCCVQKETTKGRDGHEANRLRARSTITYRNAIDRDQCL